MACAQFGDQSSADSLYEDFATDVPPSPVSKLGSVARQHHRNERNKDTDIKNVKSSSTQSTFGSILDMARFVCATQANIQDCFEGAPWMEVPRAVCSIFHLAGIRVSASAGEKGRTKNRHTVETNAAFHAISHVDFEGI